jgi:hypothetical protein
MSPEWWKAQRERQKRRRQPLLERWRRMPSPPPPALPLYADDIPPLPPELAAAIERFKRGTL